MEWRTLFLRLRVEGSHSIKTQNGSSGAIHFFPPPFKMRSLENAVTQTLEELELEEYIEHHIQEVEEDQLYYVTFQERENGNKRIVISVRYSTEIGGLLDDESWEGDVEVKMIRCEGMGTMTGQVILELLAVILDDDYFDSDSEEESDDDTLSQPRTPPPRVLLPLVPRLRLSQRG